MAGWKSRTTVSLLAIAGMLALAACGGDDSGGTAPPDTGAPSATEAPGDTAPGGDAVLVIEGFAFGDLTVAPGQPITIENRDGADHTVSAVDGSFGISAPAGSETVDALVLDAPGSYDYVCNIHAGMTGTIVVEG